MSHNNAVYSLTNGQLWITILSDEFYRRGTTCHALTSAHYPKLRLTVAGRSHDDQFIGSDTLRASCFDSIRAISGQTHFGKL